MKKKYRKPRITVKDVPVNFLYKWDQQMNNMLIQDAYADSFTLYLPIILNPSDRRLKKNIRNVSNPIDSIQRLRAVRYEWKNSNRTHSEIGLLAQEVKKVFPDIVEKMKGTNYLGIQYSSLVALLIEAVKEQQNQIDLLKKKLRMSDD